MLYQQVTAQGATVVGDWPVQGYDFASSTAVVDERFVGLTLDDKNQPLLTDARVEQWVAQIKLQIEAVLKLPGR